MGAVLLLFLPVGAAEPADGITFSKGTDYAAAEAKGWVSDFQRGGSNASYNLTISGLAGATLTIDELVVANQTDGDAFKVNVTSARDGPGTLTLRFWSGDVAPSNDTAQSVCAVVDAATAGLGNTTCSATTVHIQYVLTLPEDATGTSPFSFRLEAASAEAPSLEGGGGGGPAIREGVTDATRRMTAQEPPAGASHSYQNREISMAEGGELELLFPIDEDVLKALDLELLEACEDLVATVDRYDSFPTDDRPPDTDDALAGVELSITCAGQASDDRVGSVVWQLSLSSETASGGGVPAERVHALQPQGGSWRWAGQATQAGDRYDLAATSEGPGLLAIIVDEVPPGIEAIAVDAADGSGAVKLVISSTDNVQVATIEILVDGEPITVPGEPPFTVDLTARGIGTEPATLQIFATDISGLSNQLSRSIDLVPDLEAPSIQVAMDGPGQSGELSLKVQASDEVGVDQVIIRLRGGIVARLDQAPYETTVDVSHLSPGAQTVAIQAIDVAGNARTVERVFEVEHPAPDARGPGARPATEQGIPLPGASVLMPVVALAAWLAAGWAPARRDR